MTDYTGRQASYRWNGNALEVTGAILVPLSEEVRRILTTLWEQYNAEAGRAKSFERMVARYQSDHYGLAAAGMWRTADDTAAMVSTICYDLFGVGGPDHLHTESCVQGYCPIYVAGFAQAQETVHDWLPDKFS